MCLGREGMWRAGKQHCVKESVWVGWVCKVGRGVGGDLREISRASVHKGGRSISEKHGGMRGV